MKIIHIHSYNQFIDRSTKCFENSYFENSIILLGVANNYIGSYKDDILHFKPLKKNLQKIISLCEIVDLVVLYNLDGLKSYVANRLPHNVKVIWRFFGMELYSKIPNYVFSELTSNIISKKEKVQKEINIWENTIRPFLSEMKWGTNFNNERDNAITRIDYFLGLSETEYFFLKEFWPTLPDYMQHPFSFFNTKIRNKKKKNNKIVIGNNRSAYNNHLDILRLIKESENKYDYSFYMMFNYGPNNVYSNIVREEAAKNRSIKVIEDLMPFGEYQNFFLSVDAFVLNGYRQMAMGAVFESLISSVKVYLNEKNVIFQWLKEEDFLIFTMADFSNDLITNDISLSIEQVEYNTKQFEKFKAKYNLEDFHNMILDLIK